MAVSKRNLRYCEILHESTYYDVLIGVDTLDEVDGILQDWALAELGEALDLPTELTQNKDITEILTTLNVDNYVYLQSAVSSYMDVPRSAGLSGTLPTFPTELVAGKYVMPATTVFLWSEPLFAGYFGEYTVATASFTLASGINYIGITFNSGTPIWQLYSSETSFNYSSIIPVIAILNFSDTLYLIPLGQTGSGLPEKLLENQQKRKKFDIITDYTLATDTNYVELSALTVNNGTQDIDCLAVDTETVSNDMYLYYKDVSQVWQNTKVTQINNTQYQSGSGLASLAGGEFVINNIYRVIDDTNLLLFSTLSNKFASLDAAVKSVENTTLPDNIKYSSVLVGRIIVEKDSTSPTIQQVQKSSFGIA
jgi:hypothetical protein